MPRVSQGKVIRFIKDSSDFRFQAANKIYETYSYTVGSSITIFTESASTALQNIILILFFYKIMSARHRSIFKNSSQ